MTSPMFASAFPRVAEIRQENLGGDVRAADVAWLCDVAEAAAAFAVHLSRVEPMQFKTTTGCERWNRLEALLRAPERLRSPQPRRREDGGYLLVEQPECEHTPRPSGCLPWHDWAAEAKTHRQERCPVCGLWAIWRPKEKAATDV